MVDAVFPVPKSVSEMKLNVTAPSKLFEGVFGATAPAESSQHASYLFQGAQFELRLCALLQNSFTWPSFPATVSVLITEYASPTPEEKLQGAVHALIQTVDTVTSHSFTMGNVNQLDKVLADATAELTRLQSRGEFLRAVHAAIVRVCHALRGDDRDAHELQSAFRWLRVQQHMEKADVTRSRVAPPTGFLLVNCISLQRAQSAHPVVLHMFVENQPLAEVFSLRASIPSAADRVDSKADAKSSPAAAQPDSVQIWRSRRVQDLVLAYDERAHAVDTRAVQRLQSELGAQDVSARALMLALVRICRDTMFEPARPGLREHDTSWHEAGDYTAPGFWQDLDRAYDEAAGHFDEAPVPRGNSAKSAARFEMSLPDPNGQKVDGDDAYEHQQLAARFQLLIKQASVERPDNLDDLDD